MGRADRSGELPDLLPPNTAYEVGRVLPSGVLGVDRHEAFGRCVSGSRGARCACRNAGRTSPARDDPGRCGGAVLDGTVNMKALDGMLIRRLATTIRFGSMDHGDTTEPIDVAAGGDVDGLRGVAVVHRAEPDGRRQAADEHPVQRLHVNGAVENGPAATTRIVSSWRSSARVAASTPRTARPADATRAE